PHRRDTAGERCGQEGPRRQPDVDVEVSRLAVDEEVVERLQAAALVGPARDCPARQDESYPRVSLPRPEIALVNDGEPHVPSLLPELPHSLSGCLHPPRLAIIMPAPTLVRSRDFLDPPEAMARCSNRLLGRGVQVKKPRQPPGASPHMRAHPTADFVQPPHIWPGCEIEVVSGRFRSGKGRCGESDRQQRAPGGCRY